MLNIKMSFLLFCLGFAGSQASGQIDSEEYQDAYQVDSVAPKSILFESPPHRYSELDSQTVSDSGSHIEDTLELK
jgi:hypothetical protein